MKLAFTSEDCVIRVSARYRNNITSSGIREVRVIRGFHFHGSGGALAAGGCFRDASSRNRTHHPPDPVAQRSSASPFRRRRRRRGSFDRGYGAAQRMKKISNSLQWGRGLSTADSCTGLCMPAHGCADLQWGRGLSTADTEQRRMRRTAGMLRFNGAAVFRPRIPRHWHVVHGRTSLQWGRGLSTAEIDSAKRAGRRLRRSFNGAAVFRPRIRRSSSTAARSCTRASMGPRSFDRGYVELRMYVQRPRASRFNGAAVFRPRRPDSATRGSTSLQWGRGLSTAETGTRAMGELRSFNGAAVFRPRRRHCGSVRLERRCRASMGPRSFDRGNDRCNRR